MDTKDDAKRGCRRRHGSELKRQVVAECLRSGASVARVAMAHGLNANLVHKWRRQAQADHRALAPPFIPIEVAGASAMCETPQIIELELQRGSVSVRVRWPMAGADSCAAWLREILR